MSDILVSHGSEIQFVFGQVPPTSSDALPGFMLAYGDADKAGRSASTIMMDYWISFAVSLNPNDGKGVQRQSLGDPIQLLGQRTNTMPCLLS